MLSPYLDVAFLIVAGLGCTFAASRRWRAAWWLLSVANAVFLVLDLQQGWRT